MTCHWCVDCCQEIRRYSIGKLSMLKIQRSSNGKVVFTLSGRIEAEDVTELRRLFELESAEYNLVLDLRDVTLVDRDAVKFLARCETESIRLENCPPYIREWIDCESDPRSRRKRVNAPKSSPRKQKH
jgi:hypothetical protein